MMMTEDLSTDVLIDALVAAAKRGVKVEVAADIFTYGEFGGHFIPLKYYTKKSRAATAMAKRLIQNGAKFTWLGRFSATPITGRTHIKCLAVDDTVYSFGGVNLDDRSLDFNDYMFRCDDADLAAELRKDIAKIIDADNKNVSYISHSFPYNGFGTVHVDRGFQGNSVIYKRACQLAEQATDILFVSQYCPTGKLNRLLHRTKSRMYFNTPGIANNRLNAILLRTAVFLTRNKTLYTRSKYLHAKFMIFTMPSGEKIALTGSHNFVPTGVFLGTREIALETSNKKIVAQLEKFFKEYVK